MENKVERMYDTKFRADLERLLNHHSMENGSDTPDYALAVFLCGCLAAYNEALELRERAAGRILHKDVVHTVLDS